MVPVSLEIEDIIIQFLILRKHEEKDSFIADGNRNDNFSIQRTKINLHGDS